MTEKILFSDFFKFEDYQVIEEIYNQEKDTDSYKKYYNAIKENFDPKVWEYLNFLKKKQKMFLIKNQLGHHTSFSFYWSKFIQQTEPLKSFEMDLITDEFTGKILFQAVQHSQEQLSNPKNLTNKYNLLVEKMNSGNFSVFDFYHNHICLNCYKALSLEIKNWVLEYSLFDEKSGFWRGETPEKCPNSQ